MTDYTDLKRRLEEGRTTGSNLRWTVTPIHREAAAAIAALEAERDALRGALREGSLMVSDATFAGKTWHDNVADLTSPQPAPHADKT